MQAHMLPDSHSRAVPTSSPSFPGPYDAVCKGIFEFAYKALDFKVIWKTLNLASYGLRSENRWVPPKIGPIRSSIILETFQIKLKGENQDGSGIIIPPVCFKHPSQTDFLLNLWRTVFARLCAPFSCAMKGSYQISTVLVSPSCWRGNLLVYSLSSGVS